jgi:histidinol-phosphatase (PHP family)
MYYTDYHAHSNCSFDGQVPMHEMAAAAVASGLSEFCLTDHFDMLSTEGERRLSYDWSCVLKQREELLALYADKLVLPMGLELSMSHIDTDTAHRILSQPGLDFVIGSIHNHSEKNGGVDFYYGKYTNSKICYETLDDYFSSMETLAPLDTYDVLGHIIYPLRYMTARDGQSVLLGRYLDIIRAILRSAVEHGHGIEVNTWTGKTLEDWRPVLRLYRDCGGEIITTGSDAHIPDGVGKGIPQVYDLLRESGFRYVTVYRARRPQFIKL